MDPASAGRSHLVKAQENLRSFLRQVERIHVYGDDDAFKNELEDYKNNDADGVTCTRPTDFVATERARLDTLLELRDELLRSDEVQESHCASIAPNKKRSKKIGRQKKSSTQNRRNYALRAERFRMLQGVFAKDKTVPNPYNRGCYHFIIESLKALGVNNKHNMDALRRKAQELMGPDRWRAFANRERQGLRMWQVEDVEADIRARLHCNCRVLQRTKDYGLKLLQVGQQILRSRGCVIDILFEGNQTIYRLNTRSDMPQYEGPRWRAARAWSQTP
jgi:hypothetical protein